MFLEHGYTGTSMSEIAQRAGGSKATLYQYFKNKEELFDAHIQECCLRNLKPAFDQQVSELNLATALTTYGARLLTALFTDELSALVRLIVSEARNRPSVGLIFHENGPKRGLRSIGGILDDAVSRGEIWIEDRDRASRDFLALLTGNLGYLPLMSSAKSSRSLDLYAEARHASETFLRAYGMKNSSPIKKK